MGVQVSALTSTKDTPPPPGNVVSEAVRHRARVNPPRFRKTLSRWEMWARQSDPDCLSIKPILVGGAPMMNRTNHNSRYRALYESNLSRVARLRDALTNRLIIDDDPVLSRNVIADLADALNIPITISDTDDFVKNTA